MLFYFLGLTFSFVTDGSEMLHLKESGALIFDPGHTEASLLGDVNLSQGKHCWGFHIKTHGYNDICIGVFKHLGEVLIAYELHSTLPQKKELHCAPLNLLCNFVTC